MPRLNQVDSALTDTLTLPESGVSFVILRKATGRHHREAVEAMLGDAFVTERDPVTNKIRTVDQGFNARRRYARYLCHLASFLIQSWDALDSKGDPLPVSAATLGSMASDADYTFIIDAAAERVTVTGARQADGPFAPPSEASSSEMNSPTPENSSTSSTS